jgi:Periplasmic binding protein
MTRLRVLATVGILTVALLGCTSGDDTTSTGPDDSGGSSTTTEPSATGPSPGVTDDTIKIGVTYVDTEPLKKVGLDYDLGDHRAVYQALADHINDEGGINGRKLEMHIEGVDATTAAPGEEQCVKLTEDDDVFLMTGFYLGDSVLCPVATHATAVAGGNMTPERLDQADAPWLSWLPDTDQPKAVVESFDERGELDGKVAVFAAVADKPEVDNQVMPALEKAGIEPVETGISDAPPNDPVATQSAVKTIAEKFKAAGADTVLIAGASGANWPTSMADDTSYRPKLLFLDTTAPRAFATSDATTDTSILEGSLSGGQYGPDQARFEEPEMQKCVAILEDAGIDTPAPKDFDPADKANQPYQAAFQACPDMALTQAWLEAAGKDLNYGTLAAAQDGLKIVIPGDPTKRTYGPPPAADGDPGVYFFGWDVDKRDFVLDEG